MSISDLSFFLEWIIVAILILAGLAVLLNISAGILRRVARQNSLRHGLDLVGQAAEVTRTIRPGRAGQIRCHTLSGGPILAEARGDRIISKGTKVLITSGSQDYFQVMPIDQDDSAGILP